MAAAPARGSTVEVARLTTAEQTASSGRRRRARAAATACARSAHTRQAPHTPLRTQAATPWTVPLYDERRERCGERRRRR
eukprot:2666559-Pleurochrysis_carterae.AAC.1